MDSSRLLSTAHSRRQRRKRKITQEDEVD